MTSDELAAAVGELGEHLLVALASTVLLGALLAWGVSWLLQAVTRW